MTYLQVVNSVLRRLRERQVASVTTNTYSAMLGDLVNDAVYEVERAWDWSSLRSSISVATVDGTGQYALTGSDNQFEVTQVLDTTNDHELMHMSTDEMVRKKEIENAGSDIPMYYAFNGVDANGDTLVELYPTPNGAYTLSFNGFQRSTNGLTLDADEVSFPAQPVILLAWAKAIEERGEDSGVMMSSAYATAARALSDAIAHDAARHPDKLMWSTV